MPFQLKIANTVVSHDKDGVPAILNTPRCIRCQKGGHLCIYPNPEAAGRAQGCAPCVESNYRCSLGPTPLQRTLRSSAKAPEPKKSGNGKRKVVFDTEVSINAQFTLLELKDCFRKRKSPG